MTREIKALVFMDSQFSNSDKAKVAALYVGAKLGIPGAKKAFKRKVINYGSNKVMNIGTKLIADKLKIRREKALASVEATRDVLSSIGTPNVGKMLIK